LIIPGDFVRFRQESVCHGVKTPYPIGGMKTADIQKWPEAMCRRPAGG
jgi:hypothetical protein